MEARALSSTPRSRATGSSAHLLDELTAQYESDASPIAVDFRALVPNVAATERATHALHPYPAKLLRHIPALFGSWELLAKPGDVILDPFCGSGTVLVEAALGGRAAIGVDANPLAALIAEVKTTHVFAADIKSELALVCRRARRLRAPTLKNESALEYWFPAQTLEQLARLANAIAMVADGPARRLLQVCLSAVARQLSLADPRISVPVRLRPDQYPPGHWLFDRTRQRLSELEPSDAYAALATTTHTNLERIASFAAAAPGAQVTTILGDSRSLPTNAIASSAGDRRVDAIITSPPYLSAQKYIRASSIGLLLLDLVPDGKLQALTGSSIGREHFRKMEYTLPKFSGLPSADGVIEAVRERDPLRAHLAATYISEMDSAICGFARVLRPGGICVLVVGPNRLGGEPFDTPMFLERLAHRAGFATTLVLVDTIRSRGLMTRRNKSAAMIAEETVLVLQLATADRDDDGL